MNHPLVTIITASTGAESLKKNIESVANQSYKNFQHLVVFDGPFLSEKINLTKVLHSKLDVIELPYSTGADNYLCHRIYGGFTYIAKGDFICFLDEDNWMEENHISTLLALVSKYHWTYALRNIVDQDGIFVCQDNCESLGKWPSVINKDDYLVDTNCFFLPKHLALNISPLWFKKARQPNKIDADRAITLALKKLELKNITYSSTGMYTINYRLSNRIDAPKQKEFFLKGNNLMKKKYENIFPWTKS